MKSAAGKTRVVAQGKNAPKVARQLWRGLSRFNQETAGPFHYSRIVLTARGKRGTIVGGVILQSYWTETYVELLWLSERARRQGLGRELIQEAERRARRRGSRLIHLSTYSFQAPGFYEKLGFRRCGRISGSPKGATRYFYVKRL
ncbi:MAG TPA: GNAT family N-acetyltransferase [Burkholderiales bacterium]|nr:GNAT family N-acetyltransferase [Burkholderiales bacterium]